MNLVLLSGGSGARLWPLSNETRSKQFIKIFRNDKGEHESMLQRMYRMVNDAISNVSITIATSKSQISAIKSQLGDKIDISIEPFRRDTFPAIALSAAYLHDIKGVPLDEPMVVCPVDPYVNYEYFKIIEKMNAITNESNLILMGIKPTYPSEKYGYIIQNGCSVVFKEKPNFCDAQKYIDAGALWNGGVFAFKIRYVLDLCKEICGISGYKELFDNYENLKKISFDYAVAEHEKSIKVVEYSGEWKDLGTWNTFTEVMKDYIGGNAVLGEHCENTHIVNELSIPIIGLGLKNIVVAASPDGILVSEKNASAQLKKYVPNNRPMFESKEWGEYRVLKLQTTGGESSCVTRELLVFKGKETNPSQCLFKKIVWVVSEGSGILTVNGKKKKIKKGDSLLIKCNDHYSFKAIDDSNVIEIQII